MSHIIELIDTDPASEASFPEKIIINPLMITTISLKNNTVTLKTCNNDVFVFTRGNSTLALDFYYEMEDKLICVNRFVQDETRSDCYNNFV